MGWFWSFPRPFLGWPAWGLVVELSQTISGLAMGLSRPPGVILRLVLKYFWVQNTSLLFGAVAISVNPCGLDGGFWDLPNHFWAVLFCLVGDQLSQTILAIVHFWLFGAWLLLCGSGVWKQHQIA